MDTKTLFAMLARTGLKALAGFLIGHGCLQASGTEAFIGGGMVLATAAWSFWNDYGKAILVAELDMLKLRVQQRQAAQGQGTSSVRAPTIALLIAATALLGIIGHGVAHAQNVAPRPQPPRLTGNPVVDFAPKPASTPGASGAPAYDSIGGKLQEVAKDVIDRAIADLTAASLDAKGTADLISQPCWDAQVAFLKLLPAEWPTPPTEVGPALAIQIGRDLRRALTSDSQGSLKVACAALFGDELQQAGKLFSILGLRTAGLALGLPL